jgi:hypothetical protein
MQYLVDTHAPFAAKRSVSLFRAPTETLGQYWKPAKIAGLVDFTHNTINLLLGMENADKLGRNRCGTRIGRVDRRGTTAEKRITRAATVPVVSQRHRISRT